MYKKLMVLALVLAFALAATPVLAEEASGTLSIELKSVSAVMGGSWGDGVLTFQGKTHTFKVKGLKVLSVGVKKTSLNGEVYKLAAATDLAGTYQKAAPAGFTFIKGEKGLVVQNDKGVVLNLLKTKKGLDVDLLTKGLTIDKVE